MQQTEQHADHLESVLGDQLLLAVIEQLKLPLLQLARQAELGRLSPGSIDLAAMQATADSGLRLLDSYLFGARLALEPHYQAILEPVAIASVLYESSQQLAALAQQYGVQLQLDIDGRFAPVLANRQALQSAMTSLGYALIEALPSLQAQSGQTTDSGPQLTLHLAVHNSRYGVVAGVYSATRQPLMSRELLRRGRALHGHIRQPLAALSPSSGAGVFVADAILQAMDSSLQPTRHRNLYGLGAVLRPTPQLQLI